MRLLRIEDGESFSLVEHVGNDIPSYAILSHTWGADGDEVTFRDLNDGTGQDKAGYRKIRFCGKQAAHDGLQYFWVDTCCIDKSSSAELTESINSMFQWYQNAARCYVYMPDVSISALSNDDKLSQEWMPAFKKSRWFTRGWTLQELIAPTFVDFFSYEKQRLGDKQSLEQILHEITGIAIDALRGRRLSYLSVHERMGWAASRQTKRAEDQAYCLLGIFDVSLPLIYGEGRQKAMYRLQKEIRESSEDQSLALLSTLSIKQQPERQRTFSTIPFRQDPDFVDRLDILTWLHERCEVPAGRAALTGLGGVGKSQLAIRFCHQVRAQSQQISVFWVHVGTRARFQEGYRRIAEAVKMKGFDDPRADIIRLVYSWLCDESNGRWLMVIDNADDSKVFFPQFHGTQTANNSDLDHTEEEPLSDFLPQSSNGSILVTSRNRDVAYRLTGSHTCIREVKPMNEQDALALLSKKTSSSAQDDAVELLQALDYMPLAITQAAACIEQRAPRMTISRYIDEIRRSDTRLLEKDMGDTRRDGKASNSIIMTWQVSFEYIRIHIPTAARLLSLMSFFDRQGIPETLLHDRYQKKDEQSDFDDDIHALLNFSLVRISGERDEFEMHRLVQFTTRKWLELHSALEEWKEIYLETVNEALPEGSYENWKICQKLFPHAEMALEYQPSTNGYSDQWGSILYKVAWYASRKGEYRRAEEMDRRLLEVRERVLGKEHRCTIKSVEALGNDVRDLGKYTEAEELHVRALKWKEKNLGLEHTSTVSCLNGLGVVLSILGKDEEAETMHRRALEISERVHGRIHRETLTYANNLGLVLRNQGRYGEAETISGRVVEDRESLYGPEHPSTLNAYSNLVFALMNQGNYQEAEPLCRRVLEAKTNVLGPKHPFTIISVGSLGSVLEAQGKYEEAEGLYRQALEASENVFGPDHPDTISTVHGLGVLLTEQCHYEEAELLLRRALEAREKSFGSEDQDALNCAAWLRFTLEKQGKAAEPEPPISVDGSL
jgi:tetratricopeptide (TPR) repeat protein